VLAQKQIRKSESFFANPEKGATAPLIGFNLAIKRESWAGARLVVNTKRSRRKYFIFQVLEEGGPLRQHPVYPEYDFDE